ncbi:sensor histidine kinase [Actinocrispum wychmicini]|uniref:histidine kinase n=1 Tax=Actinocrispum wychmicini TaxID=1213861 RepID=A0A4R2J9J1_9PSEU|nr:ATP-binding protein [Actinocrispum wychmicini]TCO55991.1 histidine kinase/DNA gyrase B/HSP90-like ATPase [Actinocrispum wychmicini]
MRHMDVSDVLTVVLFVGAGVTGWRVRPRNRVGPLMVAVGVCFLFRFVEPLISDSYLPPFAILANLWVGVVAHLAMAFPTGRLGSLWRRALVLLIYLYLALTNAAPRAVFGWLPSPRIGLVTSEFALAAAVVVAQVVHWWRATPTQRRLIAPAFSGFVVVAGLFAIDTKHMAFFGSAVIREASRWSLPLIPIAYLVGLLRRRLDRADVAGLVVRLSETRQVTRLTEELAVALHDPCVRLAFWSTARGAYVDADGDPVGPHGAGRAVTHIDRGGRHIALLEHDVALVEEPELVEATCAAAALALENERLQADLHARLRELAASRTRLAHAADTGRRRVERDLHDGVQERLLAAVMLLGRAEQTPDGGLVTEAKATVLASLAELRALCQGIHPPVLTERGLPGALRELADTAPIHVDLDVVVDGVLAPGVESAAYYVVAEALANVVKHAGTDRVGVTVHRDAGCLTVRVHDDGCGGADPAAGSGLVGLADRVEALGGRLAIACPSGGGTTITAELPCAS